MRRFFEQLGGPVAKNPIRPCARILLSDQNIFNVLWPMVEELMKVLWSASVSQPFYTENLICHFGRKIYNALKNVLMR